MKPTLFIVLSLLITGAFCHKYFIQQIDRPPPTNLQANIKESALKSENKLISNPPHTFLKSSSPDVTNQGGSSGSVKTDDSDASEPKDVTDSGSSSSSSQPDQVTSNQTSDKTTNSGSTKTGADPQNIPITDQQISKYMDEITIYLKGQETDDCKIDHLLRDEVKAKFSEIKCKIADATDEVVCAPKCNQKVVITINSGRLVHYFRLVEGTQLHMLAIPADMPRKPETDITLSEEEAIFTVNNYCSDNYRCRVKSTKNDRTLIKVENNECASHNIAIPIRYSISDSYYSYCGANQAKVMFYANKSFYSKDNKFKYVPFTVTQTGTSKKFPLKMQNPYMEYEMCNFQITKSDGNYKDKCDQANSVGDEKCYKYCGGDTTLDYTGESGDVTDFKVKITTRHGEQIYNIKANNNNVAISDITQTSASFKVSNTIDNNKCFPSLLHAKLPGIPMTKICGDVRNEACANTCATKTIINVLTPNTAYILQMDIGTTANTPTNNLVNTFFVTNKIKFNETQTLIFGDTMIIKPETEELYKPYLPKMKCYVRYSMPRKSRKVVATCSDGEPCVGLCSHKFDVVKLPVNITLSIELVHAGHIDHPVFQISQLIRPDNNPVKATLNYDRNEKTLTIVPDSTRLGKLCDIVLFAIDPTDSKEKFLYERKGKYTDEDIDCGSSVVFNNIDTKYDYELMSDNDLTAKPIQKIEVGKQELGGWMKNNWWIILAVVGALIAVIGGVAFMANKSSD